MTPKEAKAQIRLNDCELLRTDGKCPKLDHCRWAAAIEALNKQIPQKAIHEIESTPIYDENGKWLDTEEHMYLTCPQCGNLVGYEDNFSNYCSECGQAIGGVEE